MRVGERGHQAELPIEFSNHAKRRFGGDLGVNPIVPPMVCSQALRPSLQSDQKRYSVGDGSLILRYSSSAAGTHPDPQWVPVVSEEHR